jgi:hypothetical protein
MARNSILIAACALALITFASARAQDSSPSTPSLGDLARQAQKDKDKDKGSKPAAKVLTNDDLPASSSGAFAALGGGFGPAAELPPGGKPGAESSPAERLAMMEAALNRLESMDRPTLIRAALNGKDVDFQGRAAWENRLVTTKETYVTQARELVQKAREIAASADDMKGGRDPNDPRIKDLSAKLQALVRDAVRADSAMQAVMIEGRDLAAQPAAH